MQKITLEISEDTNYVFTEAFRTLRTNIELYGKETKVIGVTSVKPLEGKSTVAFNLARSLAEVGKKVIFVDADIRKSNVVNKYKVEKEVKGLKNYLSGENSIEDIIYTSNINELDIVFAGRSVADSTELLDSTNLIKLISKLKTQYDHVIIDTPSFGSITDATIIIRESDGAILVVEEDKVSYKVAKEVVDKINETKCTMLGVVLNKVVFKENLNLDSSYYEVGV